MIRFVLPCVLAAALVFGPGSTDLGSGSDDASAGQQQVFRVGADVVPVYATVTDRSGRLVTDLARDDFQVLDNGKPQEITLFDNSPQPIRLIIMLDVSGSMAGNVRLVQQACEQLFGQLRPDDEVKVGTFGNDITIMPAFTNNIAALRAGVPDDIAGGPTPLWRAVDRALGEFGEARGRRVILVLSDGKNAPVGGGRYVTVLEVIDRAQREDVMVYAVGLHSRYGPGAGAPRGGVGGGVGGGFGGGFGGGLLDDLPDPELPRVAAETGGGYFEIKPKDDLGAAFARVADELHRQYVLGFVPPSADGRLHKLEVKVRTNDMRPRARKNYLAPSKPK